MHWLDPDYLPKTVGTLERFVLNPEGDVDGLLLVDGTEIHTPPHLSQQIVSALAPGTALTVSGVKAVHSKVIVAVAIDTDGKERIVDHGPEHQHEKPHKPKHAPEHPPADGKPAIHHGRIRSILHGPKGRPHGVLLEDGTTVRFPPHATEQAAPLMAGDTLSVRGKALVTAHGTVIDAHALGRDAATLSDIDEPHQHKPKKTEKKPAPKDHKHPPHHSPQAR